MVLPPPFDRGPAVDLSFGSWPRWPLDSSDSDLAAGEVDAARLLWNDTDLHHAPRANAARVAVAIEQTLRALRPLAGGEHEFLELFARLEAVESRAFAAVWGDPRAYHLSLIHI